MKKVLFIGLSDKIGCTPLQSDTKSGIIIDMIIAKLNAQCYKINLANFTPLDEKGKLRYPNKEEMDKGYENLIKSIDFLKPDVCVLLGDKVTKYLSGKLNNFVSIKHPSYIAVYKRKNIEDYVHDSVNLINEIIMK